MLSIGAKRYIEDTVKEQYQTIDTKETSNITLKRKIGNFDRFLEIYKKHPKYQEIIEPMVEEIERVAVEQGMLSFYKVAKIETILDIVLDIKKIEINENNHKIEAFKALKIINDNQIFEQIFKTDENANLIITTDRISEVEKSLESMHKENLIPYAKAFFICQNQSEFEKIENRKMPINIYWSYISNLFIAYLELANKVKDQVMEQYATEKLHIKEYLQEIIKNYEDKINFKYIPSSVLKIDNDTSEEEESISSFIEINQSEELNKIKLIGYAGVGKTTTLEYIEYQDAIQYEETQKIPVIISLITVEKDEKIENLIAKKLRMNNEEIENDDNIEIVKYLIEKNKINLYLDGVNEISISNYIEKRSFLNRLEEFVNEEKNGRLKIIVTDRDNSEVSILNNADTFLIQGMTENDIEDFIEGNAKPEKVEEIKKVIKENEEFADMVMHPIVLKNLITIIECGEQIPEDVEELSEVYLNSIIKRELEEKKEPLAGYINDALTYMVKQAITPKNGEELDWTANSPTSYFKVIDVFYDFAKERNIDLDAENLLNLIKKMGILKEVEFQKYAFSDEKFFHIYYYNAISE